MPPDNSSSGRWQWKQSQFSPAVHRVFLSLKHVQTLHRHLTKYSILWFQFVFFSVEILSKAQDLEHWERLLIYLIKSFQKNTWDQVVFALLVCAQLMCISAFLGWLENWANLKTPITCTTTTTTGQNYCKNSHVLNKY